MLSRRHFFRSVAALAALPLVRNIPVTQSIGAWATAHIVAGSVVSITIISAGSGYTSPPVCIKKSS